MHRQKCSKHRTFQVSGNLLMKSFPKLQLKSFNMHQSCHDLNMFHTRATTEDSFRGCNYRDSLHTGNDDTKHEEACASKNPKEKSSNTIEKESTCNIHSNTSRNRKKTLGKP